MTVESRYLDHLPAIFRTPPDRPPGILGPFLRAFEDVLSGTGEPGHPGLAETINGIGPPGADGSLAGLHRYFEPGHDHPKGQEGQRTPAEFLEWLAGWVALSLRADLDESVQREFIAKAVWLYRLRGTPEGLAEVLNIYTRLGVTVEDGSTGFRVTDTGKIETVDSDASRFPPHYFEVTLRLKTVPKDSAKELAKVSRPDQPGAPSLPREVARYRKIATEIIDAEKPAHCFYGLRIISPSFQIGVTSHIGIDTLLARDHL